MKYRPEVDGLRALALIPVILFHAGFEMFGGGFVGVDVFFVVSGYLITCIILNELQQGTFSLIKFYERRARRILPALFFMMFITMPFAWFWLLPSDLQAFGQSLISVVTFSSNVFFWFESGYFDVSAELKPLLHTWTLAVEEQFYIFFPIFLIIVWRYFRKYVLAIFILIFLISLLLAQWASVYATHPKIISGSYYLLPTRGWELLAGGAVALYMKKKAHVTSMIVNQLMSVIGLALILYSVLFFDEKTPFPSFYTVMPVLGASLIILCCTAKTWVYWLLSSKVMVGIGLISYSLYLWHQPIFAFAQHRLLGDVSCFFFRFTLFVVTFYCLS